MSRKTLARFVLGAILTFVLALNVVLWFVDHNTAIGLNVVTTALVFAVAGCWAATELVKK